MQCCTRYKGTGEVSSCIEQLEIGADGNYGSVGEDGSFVKWWCNEEQELRKVGLVWGKPINLECGDVDRKGFAFEQWERPDPSQWELPTAKMDSGNLSWEE